MKEYTVRWEIDGIYAESPEEAAREAQRMIADPNSNAHIFEVRDADADPIIPFEPIDLDLRVLDEDK